MIGGEWETVTRKVKLSSALNSEALKLGWLYMSSVSRAFPQQKANSCPFTPWRAREVVRKKRNDKKLKNKSAQHVESGLNWLHWEIIQKSPFF